jgi:DNA-binding NarL/FixJ family response regulator
VRVVIADDEALLREGLAVTLGRGGFDVVGIAADAAEIVRLAEAEAPDLVVTDIRMPPNGADDGLRAAMEIRARRPATGIMVLSQYVQRRYAVELLADRAAGVGYLLKQRVADVERFCRELRRVGGGETVLDPEVVAVMMATVRRDSDRLDGLTGRQAEVLALLAEGRSNAAIARELNITGKAVTQHVSNIYAQLGLAASEDEHRRVLAVVRYLAHRGIDSPAP